MPFPNLTSDRGKYSFSMINWNQMTSKYACSISRDLLVPCLSCINYKGCFWIWKVMYPWNMQTVHKWYNNLKQYYTLYLRIQIYISENEMYGKVVTLLRSPKTFLKTLLQFQLISLNVKVINKNTLCSILHGSENITLIYILKA